MIRAERSCCQGDERLKPQLRPWKFLTAAAAWLLVAWVVSACGGKGGGSQSATSSSQPAAQAPTQTVQAGQTVKVGGFELTVGQVQVATGPNQREGHVYISLRATVKNNTKDPLVINSMNQFRVLAPSGTAARVNLYAQGLNQPVIDAQLPPGESRTGWMGFEVPKQEGKYQLVFTPPSGEKAAFEFTLPRQ